MPQTISIVSTAALSDIQQEELKNLEDAFWREISDNFWKKMQKRKNRRLGERFENGLVALSGTKVIGFLGKQRGLNAINIPSAYVTPEFRNKGILKKMARELLVLKTRVAPKPTAVMWLRSKTGKRWSRRMIK